MMMRILYITMNLNSGGAERQIVAMSSAFNQLGHHVDVICFADGSFYEQQLNENGIEVYRIKASSLIRRTLAFRKFIRKGGYDVVISYLESSNFLNTFAAIGGKSWRVITGERSSKEENLLTFKGRLFAFMQRYADAIVCNSENARGMWVKHYPQLSSKLKTIYNLINVKPSDCHDGLREDGKTHILVAASYQRLKNPLRVIEAVRNLSPVEKCCLRIDWYGQRDFADSVASECDRAVEMYQLVDIVHLHDRVHHITDLMCQADVVGLFSSVEGLPNTICEAMCLGKPIIMTRVSDYNVLVDDRNGFLCDWDDVDSIVASLRSVLKCTDEQLLTMGMESRKKADRIFSRESIMNEWLSIIQ